MNNIVNFFNRISAGYVAGISALVILIMLIFKGISIIIGIGTDVLSFVSVLDKTISFICVFGFFGFFIYTLIKRKDIAKALFYSAGLFVCYALFFRFYYLVLFPYINDMLEITDPRLLLLLMTGLLVIVIAVLYYLIFYVFEIESPMGKGFVIISFVGSILIGYGIYKNPVYLFSHESFGYTSYKILNYDSSVVVKWENGDSEKFHLNHFGERAGRVKGNQTELKADDYLVNTKNISRVFVVNSTLDLIKAECFVIRDDSGNILATSSSPGINSKYGKRYVPCLQKDVSEVTEYKKENPALGIFGDNGPSEEEIAEKEKLVKEKLEKEKRAEARRLRARVETKAFTQPYSRFALGSINLKIEPGLYVFYRSKQKFFTVYENGIISTHAPTTGVDWNYFDFDPKAKGKVKFVGMHGDKSQEIDFKKVKL